jgi:hypothetical protein
MTMVTQLLQKATRYRPWAHPFNMVARRFMTKREPPLAELAADYNVIIMKHCYPASDVLEDTGRADPSSPKQSQENYRAVYRLLRDKFDKYPDTLFIIWTLPPRHRLFQPQEGNKKENAARATAFSHWLQSDFLNEGREHPNIRIWDFRGIIMDPRTNFLKYEYEFSHESPDSHPNRLANNEAGPRLAHFIMDTTTDFFANTDSRPQIKIIFLHHSTGLNVYQYPAQGLPGWVKVCNTANNMTYSISHKWYPLEGNMPAHYYRSWLKTEPPGDEGRQ